MAEDRNKTRKLNDIYQKVHNPSEKKSRLPIVVGFITIALIALNTYLKSQGFIP